MNQLITRRICITLLVSMVIPTLFSQGLLKGLNKDKWKETVQSVVENIASEHIQFNLAGEWIYKGATVKFRSENQLANVSSQVLGNTLDNKVNEQLDKIGIKPDMLRMVFNSDSTFRAKTTEREITGTYVYDASVKILTLYIAKTIPVKVAVEVKATNVNFLFDAEGLLALIKKVGSTVQIQALDGLMRILDNYNEMQIGLKFISTDNRKLQDTIIK